MNDSDVEPLLEICSGSVPDWDSVDEKEVQLATEKLLELGILEHFSTAVSHRAWIRKTHEMLTTFSVNMERGAFNADWIQKHDCSKFTAPEVLGYTVMFGKGSGFEELTDPEEKKEWELSLKSHYDSNPHHPQFFERSLESHPRKVFESILDVPGGKTFLEESLIDMLACRGERNLSDDSKFSIEKWMSIPECFFKRYRYRDCEWVKKLLEAWMTKAISAVESNPNGYRFVQNEKKIPIVP